MIIFPWKKNKYIDDFATLLADEFYSQILPDLANEHFTKQNGNSDNKKQLKTKKNNAQKVNQAVVAAISEVSDFRKSQKLGVYGKARLHMKFMERLTELGYRQEIAKKLNEAILLKTA
jgi:hypothetical protein